MTAVFKHKKSDRLYTVIARVVASIAGDERLMSDMDEVIIKKTDAGSIAEWGGIGYQFATVQADTVIENGTQCVLYRGTDYSHWLRPLSELIDGRFEPLNIQAAAMMPCTYHLFGG